MEFAIVLTHFGFVSILISFVFILTFSPIFYLRLPLILKDMIWEHIDMLRHSQIDISQINKALCLPIFVPFSTTSYSWFEVWAWIFSLGVLSWLLSCMLDLIFLTCQARRSEWRRYALPLCLNLVYLSKQISRETAVLAWSQRLREVRSNSVPSRCDTFRIFSILDILLSKKLLLLLHRVLSRKLLLLLEQLNLLDLFLLLLKDTLLIRELLLQRCGDRGLLWWVGLPISWHNFFV